MENLPSVINVVYDEKADNYMYFDGGAAIQKNPDILVISEENIATQLDSYILPSNLKNGDVLVRNIYESEPTYVLATDATRELWKGKCTKIMDLMSRLGAVRCEFESCNVETSRRERSANADAQYKLVKVETKMNQQIENATKEYLKMTSSYNDAEPFELTHEEWEEVKEYAKKSELWQESDIRHIINQREPGIKRRNDKEFTLNCTLSSESNRILDIAFGLSGCSAFSLNAKVEEKISLRYQTTVKYSVQF